MMYRKNNRRIKEGLIGNLIIVLLTSCCVHETEPIIHVEQKSYDSTGMNKFNSIEEIKVHLDSVEYIGYYDESYERFCEIVSCSDADSLVKNIEAPKIAIYAFHMLAFECQSISTSEAVEIIRLYENSNERIGVWSSPTMRGEYTLSEEAANTIWMNELFPMTSEQKAYVSKIRNR